MCGADKEAGATCRVCGSEYSHTSCPRCGYSTWHEAPLKADTYLEKLRGILKLRKERYLTYYELMRLTAMFKPAALEKVCENDPIDVKNISSDAFGSKENRSETLTLIKGVDSGLARDIIEALGDAIA